MRQNFDDMLRVRVPSSLSERLRATANHYARSPSDVVREAVVVQLDRLSRCKPFDGADTDFNPPQAA
jgi:predicted DNA-binding protein